MKILWRIFCSLYLDYFYYLLSGYFAVLEEPDVETEKDLFPKEVQEYKEEKKNEKTEQQEVTQLTKNAVAPDDLTQISLQRRKIQQESYFSSTGKSEVFMTGSDAEVEGVKMGILSCSPEKKTLVLTSDLTQAQTDSGVSDKGDEAVLKADYINTDKKQDLKIGASEVLSLAVVAGKSNCEDASHEYQPKRSQEERTPEAASQTLCLETRAHEGTAGLSNVSGIISEEPLVYSIECKQDHIHFLAQPTQALEDDKGYKGDQKVKEKWRKTSAPKDKKSQNSSIKRKRHTFPCLKGEMVAQSTEQDSEIQILMPPSLTPNRAETVTLTNKKTCSCCTVI